MGPRRRQSSSARRTATAALLVLVTSACGGVSAFERCVEHSVEEGIEVELAREGCRAAVGED